MDRGDKVVIIDNFNDYYDPKLKYDRIKSLLKGYKLKLYVGDIRDFKLLEKIFKKEKIDKTSSIWRRWRELKIRFAIRSLTQT